MDENSPHEIPRSSLMPHPTKKTLHVCIQVVKLWLLYKRRPTVAETPLWQSAGSSLALPSCLTRYGSTSGSSRKQAQRPTTGWLWRRLWQPWPLRHCFYGAILLIQTASGFLKILTPVMFIQPRRLLSQACFRHLHLLLHYRRRNKAGHIADVSAHL